MGADASPSSSPRAQSVCPAPWSPRRTCRHHRGLVPLAWAEELGATLPGEASQGGPSAPAGLCTRGDDRFPRLKVRVWILGPRPWGGNRRGPPGALSPVGSQLQALESLRGVLCLGAPVHLWALAGAGVRRVNSCPAPAPPSAVGLSLHIPLSAGHIRGPSCSCLALTPALV